MSNSTSAKWLRVIVTDMQSGEKKANVRMPLSLANFGLKMAAKYAPDSVECIDVAEVLEAAKNGAEGKMVEVEDAEKGELVEVFVE